MLHWHDVTYDPTSPYLRELDQALTLAQEAGISIDEDLREQARRTVINRSVYKGAMSIWVIVAVGLVAIWYLTTPGDYFWPIWPISTMAVAAMIWGLVEYGKSPFRVTEYKVEREFQRLRQRAE